MLSDSTIVVQQNNTMPVSATMAGAGSPKEGVLRIHKSLAYLVTYSVWHLSRETSVSL